MSRDLISVKLDYNYDAAMNEQRKRIGKEFQQSSSRYWFFATAFKIAYLVL